MRTLRKTQANQLKRCGFNALLLLIRSEVTLVCCNLMSLDLKKTIKNQKCKCVEK